MILDKKLYTLSDLETFFFEKNIPQEKIRFFVNENRKDRKCFGIYQDIDTGKYIVYKNKADGSRFVRYEGDDETKAVSIFFAKLKEEMSIRDGKRDTYTTKTLSKKKQNKLAVIPIVSVSLIIVAVFTMISLASIFSPKKGYYYQNDNWYYYSNHNWYSYNEYYDDWDYYYGDDISSDYFYDTQWEQDMGITDFEDSYYYYYEYESYYSDSDYDSYDYDSWDSSDTDWDSDW